MFLYKSQLLILIKTQINTKIQIHIRISSTKHILDDKAYMNSIVISCYCIKNRIGKCVDYFINVVSI
jgi:hypothetical protein